MNLKLLRNNLTPEEAREIDKAVDIFVEESKMGGNHKGAVQQTVENIGASIYKGGNGYNGDFLAAFTDDGKLASYALCSLSKDIDNKLTYWILQSYIAKPYRHTPKTKEWWDVLENRAKSLFAKHIVLMASRRPEAYQKLLGKGWEPYATLIKKDI